MSKPTLDAIDSKILKYLVKNARMPFLEIARECGISGAAIHQRIRKLHESGVILGSRLVVNPKMLGFDVCAFIGICVQDPMYMMQTMERLKNIPEIVECHFITGTFNILVKLYCLDNEHLMKTIFDGILRIQGISTTQTFISLDESFQRQVKVDFIAPSGNCRCAALSRMTIRVAGSPRPESGIRPCCPTKRGSRRVILLQTLPEPRFYFDYSPGKRRETIRSKGRTIALPINVR